jgi:hypothetical protein
VGRIDLKDVTYGWIRNSLELGMLALSENLRKQIERDPNLEILGTSRPMEFDARANLAELLVPAGEVIATH